MRTLMWCLTKTPAFVRHHLAPKPDRQDEEAENAGDDAYPQNGEGQVKRQRNPLSQERKFTAGAGAHPPSKEKGGRQSRRKTYRKQRGEQSYARLRVKLLRQGRLTRPRGGPPPLEGGAPRPNTPCQGSLVRLQTGPECRLRTPARSRQPDARATHSDAGSAAQPRTPHTLPRLAPGSSTTPPRIPSPVR